ncbi:MAG: HNH endonuclease [Ignavibacteriae bacterium]|nr:HNH endonuclease [Ignavibacteria bacterium]MBI3364988.1 HNH endonuclease [Ignavibacteriota bacterium]
MAFDNETIELVFEKSVRKCHHCGKQLAWKNYGRRDLRGGWEIDHSRPHARGGTDHLNNLVASCWSCNLDKSDLTTGQFRQFAEPIRQVRHRKKVERQVESVVGAIAVGGLIILGASLLTRLLNKSTSR